MEGVTIKNKFAHPTSLLQANSNIALALQAFNERQEWSECYRNCEKTAELILRGDYNATWGTLLRIRERCPQANRRKNVPLHLVNTGLPYSLEEIVAIESSVINWLKDLNLVKQEVSKLLDIEESVRSGKLLCELAVAMHDYDVRDIGAICEPRNAATALSNVRRAFELLRKLPKVGRRYLWCENEVFAGDRGVVLGLLNDLCRSYHGRGGKEKGGLYNRNKENSLMDANKTNEKQTPPKLNATSNEKTLDLCRTDSLDEAMNLSKVPAPHPCPLKPTNSNEDLFTSQAEFAKGKTLSSLFNKSLGEDSKMLECTNRLCDSSKEAKLLDWIKKLGVKIPQTNCFDESLMKLIRSGVLLVQIVEALERCAMKGVCNNPKSSASSLHNIQQALKVLSGKKAIPVQFLFSETQILNGSKDFVLRFLDSVRLAYPHSIFPLSKH